MYIPTSFAVTDQTKLHDFIEQNSFGLLVSQVDGLPFASHLPLLLERQTGPHGCLIGHMARANPQWKHAGGQTALAIFSGPHAYISPTWYESEQVVPTWNYVAVHVYGPVQVIDDRHALRDIVEKTVQVYERAMPRPWSLGGLGAPRRMPSDDWRRSSASAFPSNASKGSGSSTRTIPSSAARRSSKRSSNGATRIRRESPHG